VSRALIGLALLVMPAAAEACATCISSAYGDRTPFGVAVVIGSVLTRVSVISAGALVARARRALHGRSSRATGAEVPSVRQGETT
jgi:hypothetical protein